MVHQKRAKVECNPTVFTVINQDNEVVDIDNQVHTRILGINMNQDLSWRSHFELGEKPLLPTLRKRLGAITHLGNTIPRKGKTNSHKWSNNLKDHIYDTGMGWHPQCALSEDTEDNEQSS